MNPSEEEKAKVSQELLDFQTKFGSSDIELLEKRDYQSTLSRSSPPVRGSVSQRKENSSVPKHAQRLLQPRLEEDKNSQAISGYDYEGWERLDTDAMIKAMEKDEEEMRVSQADGRIALSLDKKQDVRRQKELQQLQERLGVEAYSPLERRSLTVHEACKAKECHEAKEYEQALYHYERAIALDFGGRNSAALHHSRAATYMALDSLQAAENDMDTSLYFCDPNPNFWMRRAVVRAKRGRHDDAIKDLDEVLLLDPKNETTVALRRKCLELYRQQEGDRLGLKEVSSKKLQLNNNQESSSGKQSLSENEINPNGHSNVDEQYQNEMESPPHHEKRVSFSFGSEPGDFILDDIIKYDEDKRLRESHKDLACTKFERHVAHFSDGTEPGEYVPEDDLKYDEDRRIERAHPYFAKSKGDVLSCGMKIDGNARDHEKSRKEEFPEDMMTKEGQFHENSSSCLNTELERGKDVLEDDSFTATEANGIKPRKCCNLNNEEGENQQWKRVAINFDDAGSSDSNSSAGDSN